MLAMLRNFSKTTRIGLDIAHGGIRAVQCRRSGDAYSVATSAVLDEEPVSVDSMNSAAHLSPRIQNCMQLANFKGHTAAIALSPPDIEYYPIELPAPVLQGPPKEARQVLRFEVDRLTTMAGKDLEVDFWTLPGSSQSKPNTMAAAAMSETILERIRGCEGASLTCACLDASAAAAARLGSRLLSCGKDEVWSILDLGYSADRLIVCVDATPILIRNVGRGGHHWSTCVSEALQISLKSAEIQKRDHGLPAPVTSKDESKQRENGDEIASLIHKAIRSELNEMAAEIKRSYEYVLSCYPSRRARDLILIGGGAAMKNLDAILADLLGIRARRAQDYLYDPACKLRVDPGHRKNFERMALAVGLSLEPEA